MAINITNIKEGQVVNNYKSLCILLEEPVRYGNSKYSQIKKWQQQFAFHCVGNEQKIIIDKIYDSPLPEPLHKKSKYAPLLLPIITYYLLREVGETLSLTYNSAAIKFHLVNEKFEKFYSYNEMFKQMFTYYTFSERQKKYLLNNFYDNVVLIYQNILRESISQLTLKKYFSYNVTVSYQAQGEWNVADFQEAEIYQEILDEVKREKNISTINSYNRDLYYSAVSKKLNERLGWGKAYRMFVISFRSPYRDSLDLAQFERDEPWETAGKELNALVAARTLEIFANKSKEIRTKDTYENSLDPKKYMEFQQQLIDTFIKI